MARELTGEPESRKPEWGQMAKYWILNKFLLSLFEIAVVNHDTEYIQHGGFPLVYSNQDSALSK